MSGHNARVQIPEFLAHLDTDARGRPVPYINAWGTPGVQGRAEVAPDPNVDGRLSVFLADVKDEGPDFKQQNPQRQRECFAQSLCQVCARPVDPDDRYLIISPRSVEYVDIEDAKRPVINEPWVDKQCGDFATTYWPRLTAPGRRRSADEGSAAGELHDYLPDRDHPGSPRPAGRVLHQDHP